MYLQAVAKCNSITHHVATSI